MEQNDMTMAVLLQQAFTAQHDRIKMQDERITRLEAENKALRDNLNNVWEVMEKMDAKLSAAYAAAFGADGGEPLSMNEYKFGEESDENKS